MEREDVAKADLDADDTVCNGLVADVFGPAHLCAFDAERHNNSIVENDDKCSDKIRIRNRIPRTSRVRKRSDASFF